jgi:hypothetical protein
VSQEWIKEWQANKVPRYFNERLAASGPATRSKGGTFVKGEVGGQEENREKKD